MRARLIVAAGQAAGRAITLRGPRFLIGRDPGCQLRPKSPTVSRFHAALELGDGRVLVRDLGGANGTAVDGRVLHRAAVEAGNGTRIRVGPLEFLLEVEGVCATGPVPVEDQVARWLLEGAEDDCDGDAPDPCAATLLEPAVRDDPIATTTLHGRNAREPGAHDVETGVPDISCKVIQGILLITVMLPALNEESAVDQLRATLTRLHEQTSIRRVVISLCNVAFLSRSAMGVLVAHMLRLEWAGGGLRLCHVPTPVMAVLKKVHLPMLVEVYPTPDEAVLTAWS